MFQMELADFPSGIELEEDGTPHADTLVVDLGAESSNPVLHLLSRKLDSEIEEVPDRRRSLSSFVDFAEDSVQGIVTVELHERGIFAQLALPGEILFRDLFINMVVFPIPDHAANRFDRDEVPFHVGPQRVVFVVHPVLNATATGTPLHELVGDHTTSTVSLTRTD